MMAAEAYPLSWPTGWPRTGGAQRKRAKFSTVETKTRTYGDGSHHNYSERRELTIYAAMRRLTDELGRLGVRSQSILISTNVETRRDGQPRSDRKAPADPGVAVYFQLAKKDRVLACDKWDRVADNMAAIAGHIDAIRRQERYGVGTVDQAFAGYAALPPPGASAKRPWRDVLMLNEDGNWPTSKPAGELTRAEMAYRRLALNHHPDNGGSHDQMAELNDAIRQAREELRA